MILQEMAVTPPAIARNYWRSESIHPDPSTNYGPSGGFSVLVLSLLFTEGARYRPSSPSYWHTDLAHYFRFDTRERRFLIKSSHERFWLSTTEARVSTRSGLPLEAVGR